MPHLKAVLCDLMAWEGDPSIVDEHLHCMSFDVIQLQVWGRQMQACSILHNSGGKSAQKCMMP